MAAELHDGLAQELAYLSTQTALAERDPENREHLGRASGHRVQHMPGECGDAVNCRGAVHQLRDRGVADGIVPP